MENLGRHVASFWVTLAIILICPKSLTADIIISVTAPPGFPVRIDDPFVLSASWSQSNAYTDVIIKALVSTLILGESTATAYLTTRIGPGTTATDEIAHTEFTAPAESLCTSPSVCGAFVTLFSGLSLGPGDYFLTLGPPSTGVGWILAANPTVIQDTGVTLGPCFGTDRAAPYPPASGLAPRGCFVADQVVNFNVTGTAATTVPEPASATLVGFSALFLLILSRTGLYNPTISGRFRHQGNPAPVVSESKRLLRPPAETDRTARGVDRGRPVPRWFQGATHRPTRAGALRFLCSR
jgi:hypothetical protein